MAWGLLPVAARPSFLCNPGPPAQGGTTHSGLDHHRSVINQENVPQTRLQANPMEASSPSRLPPSPMTLDCVRLALN